ncbi:MAG TPA: sugar transferase [Acidimicrobiales bacterium]|jgi:lipopolysaccharide/colanic/teichoic acid biosynthesis glycosyltransferase|nr:sugar transferase [Acidimicrobiales bacterium]
MIAATGVSTSLTRTLHLDTPRRYPLPLAGAATKRTLDIVLSILLLLGFLPIVALAMAAIWLESPGSPIFHQDRIGRDGRTFRLLKIRTMFSRNSDSSHQAYITALIKGQAQQHAGMFKMAHDPRITRIGRVLRRYSIDELPQLWNVVKGDMSLVGPRPALPYEVELYDARQRQRLRVKPGVTGLWQVMGRATMSFQEMVELDIKYWESWTFPMELWILLRTPWTVARGIGAA